MGVILYLGVRNMVHTLAKCLASILVSSGEAREEDKDIYTYACEMILSVFMNIVVCLLVSAILGRLIEGILFMLCFVGLRRYAGGHHAKHHCGCIVAFSCILAISLQIISLKIGFLNNDFYIMMAIISFLVVITLAPVEHENKPIPNDMRSILKLKSRTIAFCLMTLITLGIITTSFGDVLK